MILYKTVDCEASGEQIIEKSRFIAHVCPVSRKEEADEFIGRIRREYKDASHNVPAMVIGDKFQIQWGSDDGEPQGTSGAPIVQMLVSQGITNVAVVVTRYFGGIKLGPGGLVRAYTSSAKIGLEAARIIQIREKEIFLVSFDYSHLAKFQNLAEGGEFSIEELVYADCITGSFATVTEKSEQLENLLNQVTNGSVKILKRKILQTR